MIAAASVVDVSARTVRAILEQVGEAVAALPAILAEVSGGRSLAFRIPGHRPLRRSEHEAYVAPGGGFPDAAPLPRAGKCLIMPHILSRYATSHLYTPRLPWKRPRARRHWAERTRGTREKRWHRLYRCRRSPAHAQPRPGWSGAGHSRPEARFPRVEQAPGSRIHPERQEQEAWSSSSVEPPFPHPEKMLREQLRMGYDFSEHGFCLSLLHEAPARKSRQRRWQARAACSAVLRHEKESDNGRDHTGGAAAGRVGGDA